jgi:hypothetical protein
VVELGRMKSGGGILCRGGRERAEFVWRGPWGSRPAVGSDGGWVATHGGELCSFDRKRESGASETVLVRDFGTT